jgi:hypothetical protein
MISGGKLADAWGAVKSGEALRAGHSAAVGGWRMRDELAGTVGSKLSLAARSRKDRFSNLPTSRKRAYGAGVVGVSSGAYMWHRHNLNQQYNSSDPYYY